METSTIVDLAPAITAAAMAIIGLVATFLTGVIRKKFKMDISARHADALQNALEKGALLAVGKLAEGGRLRVDLKNAAVAQVAQYALNHVPDAVDFFGKTTEDLKEMAESRVADVTIAADVISEAA